MPVDIESKVSIVMYLLKNPAAEHVCTVPAERYTLPLIEEYMISVRKIEVRIACPWVELVDACT